MNSSGNIPATMRAAVYTPPGDDFPYIAIVFHTDGTILLSRPFETSEAANKYILDVSSSLVAIASSHEELGAAHDVTAEGHSSVSPDTAS